VTCVLAAVGVFWIAVPRAQALEALDGRIQAHGFLEMQVRGLDRDFEEEFDLAQWYNVLNVELEFDILPDGWGPFDLLQAYVRLEGRFDCLYYKACGIFPSARTYGNKSRDLPLRLRDADDWDGAGVIDSNAEATPPGLVPRVPEDTRDPTNWVVETTRTVPVTGPFDTSYRPDVNYDPNLENIESPYNPAGPTAPQYARWQGNPTPSPPNDDLSYCPTNGLTGTAAQPIGCYTNRPEAFEIDKRRGFPGFDTVFDINGADGELGPNPDYFLADPDGTVNQMRALGGAATTKDYEAVFRGLALERDDPAYYVLGVEVDTKIIDAVDVAAIPPGELTQERAQQIVYGGDPEDPSYSDEDCEDGYCGGIREAGQLYTLDPMLDWKFTFRDKVGPEGGTGQTWIMAPWLPKNFFGSLAQGSNRANPFRGRATPTIVLRSPAETLPVRSAGVRYHVLDVASGIFDPLTDCDTGACTYGADPVDPRLLKLEQLLIAAGESGTTIAGHSPAVQPTWFGPYPNNFFSRTFGGDFSGIVAQWNTYANRSTFGAPIKANLPFIQQIAVSGTPGYISSGYAETIPYTNIEVTGGLGELPLRPAPDRSNLLKLDPLVAQGLYIPSRGMVEALQTIDFDDHEFNISQIDRAFNHGASQSDTYEVKEAYLDMEFLDSRLWVRAGIQNIVWGKTELFRTTDQFNAQDMAIASLPSLEESRIGLLSARAVYSFYDVGPLQDVRFELAANFDRIKPADLGACGEPYTIDVVCGATFGLAIHGVAGIGLAGVDRPPSGWDDVKGVEFGGRLEFRWDRFSFAITDFYGYNDFPYPDPIFFYERNVDPNSGRPRKAGATGPCENAAGFATNFQLRQVLLQAGNARMEFIDGRTDAAPTGEATPTNVNDDYQRRPEPYTLLGVGIDEACLKPGGAPGGPNENRFDPSKGSDLDPDDFDVYGAGSLAVPDPDSYIYQTQGQWALEGSSVDYALAYHPANQSLFSWICSASIGYFAGFSPGTCLLNLFGSPDPLIPIEGALGLPPFSEFFSTLVAGEIDFNAQVFGWRLIQQNTKARRQAFAQIPAAPLNRDVRDGLVTATSSWVARGLEPRSENNFLTIDSTLTLEQKALLGCGPFYGTRCDSGAVGRPFGAPPVGWDFGEGGGIDLLNAEGGAVTEAMAGSSGAGDVTPRIVEGLGRYVDGSESDDFLLDVWATWSDDAQPGTIDFIGGPVCTRYEPESPDADAEGNVRLPGCRGARSATANPEGAFFGLPTIEVVFDPRFTPRQDGCPFGPTMTARDGTVYVVRAVNEDGTIDTGEAARINAELTQTCFNSNAAQVSLHSTSRFQVDPLQRYLGLSQSVPPSRTLFHPLAGCENAGPDWRGNAPWLESDPGFLCDFRFRNLEADFIEGHAQVFRSELAAWSWNFLMFLAVTSCNSASGGDDLADPDCFDPELAWDVTRCSLSTPQLCRNAQILLELTAGAAQAVEIDIRPGSDHNVIRPFSRKPVPVALLGSESFDVAKVDVTTLAFGPAGASPVFDLTRPWVFFLSYRDVNGDGEKDLLSLYRPVETGIAPGDDEACLRGEMLDGTPFEGCDAIVTVTGCGIGFELAFLLPPLLWLHARRRRGEG